MTTKSARGWMWAGAALILLDCVIAFFGVGAFGPIASVRVAIFAIAAAAIASFFVVAADGFRQSARKHLDLLTRMPSGLAFRRRLLYLSICLVPIVYTLLFVLAAIGMCAVCCWQLYLALRS